MANLVFLLPNWNWSYIIVGGATGLIAFFTFLYSVLIGRKNTVIESLNAANETLRDKNKWLQEQLDLAKANSPDVLVKTLSERRKIMEEEMQSLLKDRDYSQAEVRALQAKIDRTLRIQKELNAVVGEYQRRYENLRHKVDVCPHCEAGLVELRDVHEGNWTGSQRRYECGFSELDGEMVTYCPSDPNYPKFEEYELAVQKHIIGEGYTVYMHPKVYRTGMLHEKSSMGRTREDAINNLKEDYYRNPAFSQNEGPPFEF